MHLDEEGLSAEEKIRQLIESEESKRKDLDEKKKELEAKKREIEELEKTRNKEMSAARKAVQDQIEELETEERRRYKELEEIRKRKEEEAASLESLIGEEGTAKKEAAPKMRGYGEVIEEVMRGQPGFYELTNYNVMNRLESLAGEAQSRPLTENEREFVAMVEYHAKNLSKDDFYKDKQGAQYLKQELARVDFINKTMKKDREKGQGEYEL
ncbi:hypothetical protein JW826_00150 [Candidatus Woesearchaeota archaeon]|nr:hypothetical protein [Candidatus Woesearchaeota archaeon]